MGTMISPSILAADFNRLGEEVTSIAAAGADYVHYDVMDNHFVPNLSFGFKFIEDLMNAAGSAIKSDIHLMIEDPAASLDRFLAMHPQILTFHIEAEPHPGKLIEKIHKAGAEAFLSIKPGTSISSIESWLPEIDGVLIMLVEPGFSGQKMLPETVSRIGQIKKLASIKNTSVKIEIDGGIKSNNFKEMVDLGADILVLGSGIFAEPDYRQVIQTIQEYLPDNGF